MRRICTTAAVLAAIAAIGTAGKPKLKPSVTYAKTWEAAIEEAKTLNLPVVVHSHGFK